VSEMRQAVRVGRQIALPRIRSQGKTGIQSVAAVSSTNVWFRAYYRPSTDSVHMPARSRFVHAPHYYSPYFTSRSTAPATEAA